MKTAEERFERKLEADVHSECVLWIGATRRKDGYGTFTDEKVKNVLAHRWAYRHYTGPIPAGYVVHHVCRNRQCVNPEHLQAITQKENLKYCNESYSRAPKRERPDYRDRLLSKIKKQDDGCWLWAAAKQQGYGRFGQGLAHRAVYELLMGPVPADKQLDHLCRNRACVNPAHLEPVSQRENLLRGEGFSGVNARKTHCGQGHEYTQSNTYHRRDRIGRMCQACHRQREHDRRARRREAS